MRLVSVRGLFLVTTLLASISACSSRGNTLADNTLPSVRSGTPTTSPVGTYIKHVVIVVQENRSFSNFFAGYPGADAPMSGTMIVPSTASKPNPTVTTVPLHEITFAPYHNCGCDIPHGYGYARSEWDGGKMDGFGITGHQALHGDSTFLYAYMNRNQIQPYWTMAQRYVLADHMFPTEFGASFTGHLYLISSTDEVAKNEAVADLPSSQPWGCGSNGLVYWIGPAPLNQHVQGPPYSACFDQWHTLADTLDARGISWKYYAASIDSQAGAIWSTFNAIKNVCQPSPSPGNCTGPDWQHNVISPQTRVLTDIRDGKLPSVAWITPSYADSDHSQNGSDYGPSWVAAIVNEIGKSQYWNSTAILVVWDDWGGWYDSAAPPQRDFRGLGIRVPFLIVSPYAKHGYVAKNVYEFGSIIRFVNDAFDLPDLAQSGVGYGYTDTRANRLDDSFDFTQKPRPFQAIPAKYPAAHFIHEAPSSIAPDND